MQAKTEAPFRKASRVNDVTKGPREWEHPVLILRTVMQHDHEYLQTSLVET